MLCVCVISQFAAVGQCRRDLRDRRDRRAADHQIECFSSSPQLSRSRHEKRENQVKIWLYPYCIYILLPFIAIYCRFPAIYRRFPPLLTVPAFIKAIPQVPDKPHTYSIRGFVILRGRMQGIRDSRCDKSSSHHFPGTTALPGSVYAAPALKTSIALGLYG